ncbi:MAG TPA: hypothetical protein VIY73_11665 [Polyangiaceae bacterium]
MRVTLGVVGIALLAGTLVLSPGTARGQPSGVASSVDAGGGAGRAPSVASLEAELDGDYAQAMASDCALACKALGSMRRATENLCALDPGDRCAKARERLAAATAHVKSACPECAEPLGEKEIAPRTEISPVAPPPPQEESASVASVSKRGGCAGCATTGTETGPMAPCAVGLLALLGLRRRCVRRRRG